jgi:16S rRNA (uracil1498-N3)-methyltransferase
MNLFFHSEARVGIKIQIDPAEATHIAKVLRKKTGDEIHFTNGAGKLFVGQLEVNRHEVFANIISETQCQDLPMQLEIAVAPTKNNERLEWFVEKAVEIGIGNFAFLLCKHSERTHIKMERLDRIVVSAMKQSLKCYKPELHEEMSFTEWVKNCNAEKKLIAHCRASADKKILRDVIEKSTPTAIAIGPEGDFSEEEIELAVKHGFVEVSLGNSRLRTETAALAAVLTFDIVNQ